MEGITLGKSFFSISIGNPKLSNVKLMESFGNLLGEVFINVLYESFLQNSYYIFLETGSILIAPLSAIAVISLKI